MREVLRLILDNFVVLYEYVLAAMTRLRAYFRLLFYGDTQTIFSVGQIQRYTLEIRATNILQQVQYVYNCIPVFTDTVVIVVILIELLIIFVTSNKSSN